MQGTFVSVKHGLNFGAPYLETGSLLANISKNWGLFWMHESFVNYQRQLNILVDN